MLTLCSQVISIHIECIVKIAHEARRIRFQIFLIMVRVEGLEPPRLAAPEPKSGASTNFATPALLAFSSKA